MTFWARLDTGRWMNCANADSISIEERFHPAGDVYYTIAIDDVVDVHEFESREEAQEYLDRLFQKYVEDEFRLHFSPGPFFNKKIKCIE